MLKVLGSMLILLASVGFGFQIQMDLRNHLRLLYDIRKLLLDIANETAYTMDPMEVVLEHSIHSRNTSAVNSDWIKVKAFLLRSLRRNLLLNY